MTQEPDESEGRVEVIRSLDGRAVPEFALFDFDGTLSLIREGWQQIMVPMFVDELAATQTGEPEDALTEVVREFVMELTGKQTIFQMMRLKDEVESRSGQARQPLEYKHEYHERLMQRIVSRREALRNGEATAEDWVVPGTFDLLDRLRSLGVRMILASGTDVNYVREEVELLRLDEYFGEDVYGALDDFEKFSKQQVIDSILENNSIPGERLVGFGDGYVEIQNVSESGGLAVAVATDESNRSGMCDEWKRSRLIEVGADIVVPDFQDAETLVNLIWKN